ncbi:hypothetical protein [Rhizobium laguerreae]|uniref:hypothetical protein n=1 Tax=Rhizobium laguerreae TaxID=1076926 RepID=UPI001A8E9BAA|nr:hypothetical protein [Rhizobium laguerreae]MBN9987138.1 hypothetical protein [Rhizobium laguerreae]MBY3538064.1 hypothetical protein [Rhizobium laguerreae]
MGFFRHIIGGEIGEGETMEKFFHSDVRDVDVFEEFLRSDWQLFDCRVDGSSNQAIATNAIQAYYQKTQSLWGGYPQNYILAVRDKAPAGTSLAAIMEKLDHADEDEIIALVGYNDGGLISLSSKLWPPQQGAKSADWWTGKFAL